MVLNKLRLVAACYAELPDPSSTKTGDAGAA
jgi:hypothetical protein